MQEKASDQTPLRNHGIVYFPLGFTGMDAPDRYETGLSSVVYADGTSVIFSTVQEEDCLIDTESTDSTITAGMPFAALPGQIRSELQKCDDVGTVLNYAIDHYRSDDLDLSVMRLLSGEDEENMADKICRAAARTARFRTPCGLRVGDGKAKIELLYGRQDDPFLRFCVENDRVAEIIVRKNYC